MEDPPFREVIEEVKRSYQVERDSGYTNSDGLELGSETSESEIAKLWKWLMWEGSKGEDHRIGRVETVLFKQNSDRRNRG
jgi:hypothetical protein